MKYNVDFGNGIIRKGFESVDFAKREAKECVRYTGEHIYIRDENDKKVATLLWYGTSPEDGDEVLIDFGFGFYSEWWDEEVNLPDRGVER